MRLTFFVVSRSWASNRVRTVLTVLGIALGVAIVTAIHVVDHNTIQSRLARLRPDSGQVDLELVPLVKSDRPDDIRRRLATVPGIAQVGLQQSATVAVTASGKAAGTAQLHGLAPLPGSGFQHYRVVEGQDLSDLDGDGLVLVAAEMAAHLGLEVGDRLTLEAPSRSPSSACKDGQRVVVQPENAPVQAARSVQIKGILAHERLARRNLGMVLVGSFALARAIEPFGVATYQVNRVYGTNVDRLKKDLEQEFRVLDSRSAMLGEASDERAFRNGVKVLGCLALVLGMFVVFQTLSLSLVERLRQIGLLRCLGASRRSVALVFLVDALLLAALGALLGTLLGLGLAWLLQQQRFSTLGVVKEQIESFEIPVVQVAWTAVLGACFTLAGALFPLWKARNLPPLDVLSPHGLEAEGGTDVLRGVNVFLFVLLAVVLPLAYLAMTPLLAEQSRETLIVLLELGGMLVLFGGVLLLAPPLVRATGRALLWPLARLWRLPAFLVTKSLQRSTGRFSASVCGLGVVLVALIALEHITAALRGEVVQFAAGAMQHRLYLEGKPRTPEAAQRVASLPQVESAWLYEGNVEAPFPIYGIADATLAVRGGLLEDNPQELRAYRETRSVIVSRRLALLRQLAPGMALRVTTDQGEVPYTVLRVSDAVGFFPDERAFALAHPRWLAADFCVEAASVRRIALRLAPDASPDDVLARVRAAHPDFTWAKSWQRDFVDYHLRDVTRDFTLFEILLGLILALAGVGLVNAMTIAAMGRTRELGVLRALGTSTRSLRATFVIEGVLIALLASLLAVALGLPLGALVIAGLNRVTGLEAPLVVPWTWVALAPVFALVVGVLASLVPGARAVRESPAEAVRYE